MEANFGILRYLSSLINIFNGLNDRIIIDTETKSIFLENPKCGSTTIRAAILREKYNDRMENSALRSISRKHSSFKSLSFAEKLMVVIQLFRIYDFYTVYFIIREPVARLESAYQDKILNYTSVEKDISRRIFDDYRNRFNTYCRENNFNSNVNNFVDWVVKFNIYNIHLNPQNESKLLIIFSRVKYIEIKELDALLGSFGFKIHSHRNKQKESKSETEKIDIKSCSVESKRWLYNQINWFERKCNYTLVKKGLKKN
jgi:hypothetical protein